MRIFRVLHIFILTSILGLPLIHAEELPRPVTSVYSFEIGSAKTLATYLSPLTYSGSSFAFTGNWSKAMPFSPENALMNFHGAVNFMSMLNPAQTARMLGIQAEFQWGMDWRKRLPYNLQITVGGLVEGSGGTLYLPRNGNNPANVLAYVGILASTSISYHINIGRLPILLQDNVKLPTLGAFFCPEYGETYYEIYLGNHKGLAHCGWWGNRFGISNLLTATLDFGRTALQIGYRYSFQSEWANHLSTRITRHAFVIGVIPQGIGLKKRAKANYSVY